MARLTIPDEPTSVSFTVTTAEDTFPISFSLFEKANLRVFVDLEELDQSDFTFSGTLLEGGGYEGGTVVLNDAVENTTVRIKRRVKPIRTDNFAPAGNVPVRAVDMAMNRLVAQQQDIVNMVGDLDVEGLEQASADAIEAAGAAEAARDQVLEESASLLKKDGSNIPPATVADPSGALALRTAQNLFFVTPEDFGAVPDDPATDNSAAIARAEAFLAALPYRGELRFADGRDYYFKSTLNMNRPAGVWRGSLTRLIYNGASTTTDLVVFGSTAAINVATELKDALMQGFQILSVTQMTGGTALRARKAVESNFQDVELQTQRGYETLGNNLWHGFWLEWGSTVAISGIAYVCQGDAIRVNGAPAGYSGGKSDLFINVNKISGAQVGLHLGGAFGGVYCSPDTTFISNTIHLLEDNKINNVEFSWGAEANREFFADGSVFDFTADNPDFAPGSGGANIQIDGPGECLFTFSGCWIAGGKGANVWIKSTSGAKVNFTGCRFFDAQPHATNGLLGDGVLVDGTSAFVNITGGSIHGYRGYGINPRTNGHGVMWNGMLIYSGEPGSQPINRTTTTNAIADFGNIRARSLQSLGNVTIADGQALFIGTSAMGFYTTGTIRYHEFNPNAFISYATTDPEYTFALPGSPNALKLHPAGLSLLGQPYIAWKVVSGTTSAGGAGSAVHGIPSLPARVMVAQAHVTETGGDTTPYQMKTDGTSLGFSGASPNRPWKGFVIYLRDAM